MTIEVIVCDVLSEGGKRTYTFENVGDIISDSDSKILSIEDDESNVLAEFRHWQYWRKTQD